MTDQGVDTGTRRTMKDGLSSSNRTFTSWSLGRSSATVKFEFRVKMLLRVYFFGNPDCPAKLNAGFSGHGNALGKQSSGYIGDGTAGDHLALYIRRAAPFDRLLELGVHGDSVWT